MPDFHESAQNAAWIQDLAEKYMQGPDNLLHLPGSNEPAFDLPLLAFATGVDPIWRTFKEYVGDFHWTPEEAFALAYPGENVPPDELYVICWLLPQTEKTRDEQRAQTKMTGQRWARSRIMGEELVNNGLRRHIIRSLADAGVQAIAPSLLPDFSGRPSDRYVYASNWSERHAAHVAGLGTFSLCDALITPVGKAVRIGTVVARLPLPPSSRLYSDYREYCLFFNSSTCGACIKRCPAGALSYRGHNKQACSSFLLGSTAPYVRQSWGFDGYGCGLCQVGVPCESGIPERKPGRL